MSGRAATTDVTPGRLALSVGMPDRPSPPGWSWVNLDRVARMATGHTPSRNHPEYWGGDIPWISVRDARPFHGGVIHTTAEFTNPLGIENSAAVILPKNTVCLSRTGSIGYSILLGREMATSQGFVNWICGPALEPAFLRDLFVAENSFLHSISEGVAHTTIYFPEAKAFHICLPPVNEQRRIVAKIEELFSDLDAGVAALERVRANLKRYRAAVLKAAVEGRLTEEWRKQHPATEPAAKLLERILAERRAKWEQDQLRKFKEAGKTPPKGWKEKYEAPFTADPPRESKIPASWTWATFDQLCEDITVGHVGPMKDEYREEGIPFLRSQNVRPLRFDRLGLQFIPESFDKRLGKSRLVGGELLVVRSGVNVGDACEYPMAEGRANCSDLVIARPSRFLKSGLGAIYIVSPSGQAALQLKRTGNAQPHFNIGAMRQSAVPIPPLVEQVEIVAEVDRRLSVADAAETQVEHALQRAARLRQAILKRAFEGKLVEQDPTDEPAAALLDLINAGSNGHRAVIGNKDDAPAKPSKRRSRAHA